MAAHPRRSRRPRRQRGRANRTSPVLVESAPRRGRGHHRQRTGPRSWTNSTTTTSNEQAVLHHRLRQIGATIPLRCLWSVPRRHPPARRPPLPTCVPAVRTRASGPQPHQTEPAEALHRPDHLRAQHRRPARRSRRTVQDGQSRCRPRPQQSRPVATTTGRPAAQLSDLPESSWFCWRPGFTQLARSGSWSDGTAVRR
jgi:hypothetical protein